MKPGLRQLKKHSLVSSTTSVSCVHTTHRFCRVLDLHFQKKARRACVAKITVTFVDFTFRYRIEYLTRKEEVAGAITQVLMDRLQNPIPIAADNHFLYFIRLSQQDCDKLQPNLEQVASQRSFLLRTRDGAKYFKHHIEQPTLQFVFITARGVLQNSLLPQNSLLLQDSLLPESMVWCGIHTFYQYKGLVEPYSREEAKGHLIAIIGVYNALKELHNPPNDIAHLDVRLNNICFTHPPTKQVKLIDLDRCLPSYSPVHINFEYKQSDMYTPADDAWKNFQLDWKCLGLIICFVELPICKVFGRKRRRV